MSCRRICRGSSSLASGHRRDRSSILLTSLSQRLSAGCELQPNSGHAASAVYLNPGYRAGTEASLSAPGLPWTPFASLGHTSGLSR